MQAKQLFKDMAEQEHYRSIFQAAMATQTEQRAADAYVAARERVRAAKQAAEERGEEWGAEQQAKHTAFVPCPTCEKPLDILQDDDGHPVEGEPGVYAMGYTCPHCNTFRITFYDTDELKQRRRTLVEMAREYRKKPSREGYRALDRYKEKTREKHLRVQEAHGLDTTGGYAATAVA